MSQPPYSSPPSYQKLGPALQPGAAFSIGLVGNFTPFSWPGQLLRTFKRQGPELVAPVVNPGTVTPGAAIKNGPTAAFAPAFPNSTVAANPINPYTTQNQIYAFFGIVNPNAPTQ